MLKLVATFKNSLGKNHTWNFNDPDTQKTDTEIKGLLQRMTDVKLAIKMAQTSSTLSKVRSTSKRLKQLFFNQIL